jgi:hypothetical protein
MRAGRATIAAWFSSFFENAFVSRVNRRMDMRIVRFWRFDVGRRDVLWVRRAGHFLDLAPEAEAADDQLRVRVERRPRPDVAPTLRLFVGLDVPFLRADKRPDFIALDALGPDAADRLVLILRARLAKFDQQLTMVFFDAPVNRTVEGNKIGRITPDLLVEIAVILSEPQAVGTGRNRGGKTGGSPPRALSASSGCPMLRTLRRPLWHWGRRRR